MTDKRPALGKGLSALIPDAPEPRTGPLEIDIDLISPNPFQPRAHVDDARLDDLAKSIRASGVIQPIVVANVPGGYQIIAGERRWRAAQRAGLLRVPVVVRDVPPVAQQQLQMALIENVQREDLNPVEEAAAYQRLVDEFHLTQEEIANIVGKDRSSVANYMRLLKLPEEVRAAVAGGELSMGHARALLALNDEQQQRQAAREVIAHTWSVRETEDYIRRASVDRPKKPAQKPAPDVHGRAAEERLRLALGTRVHIVRRRVGGTIEIEFTSEDELQRLYEHLTDRR
jgi:ParB family chromosome partitioning protein